VRVLRRVQHTDGISEVRVHGREVLIVLSDDAANRGCRQDHSRLEGITWPGHTRAVQDCAPLTGRRSAAKVSRDKTRSTGFRERKRRWELLERFGRILRLAARMLRMTQICLQHMQQRARLSAQAGWQPHHGGQKRPIAHESAGSLEGSAPPPSTRPPGMADEVMQAERRACSPSPLELLLFPADAGNPSLDRMWGCLVPPQPHRHHSHGLMVWALAA
jgi:hypothetical protein